MSDSTSRLPNLYQLLGLAPLESDRSKIAAAVGGLKAGRGGAVASSSEQQRTDKIVTLAEKYLLDPQRKAAYDQQWRSVYQAGTANVLGAITAAREVSTSQVQTAARKTSVSSPAPSAPAYATATVTASVAATAAAAVPAAAVSWDYSRLEQLLPQGDPAAAFDMASFLRTSGESRDPSAAEADLATLTALLADPAADAVNSSASGAALVEPMVVEGGEYQQAESLGFAPIVRGGQTGVSSSNVARRMRQRKQQALIIGGALLAAGLGGLALLGMYLFTPKADLSLTQLASAEAKRPTPTRGSGLPKIDLNTAPSPNESLAADTPPVGSGLPQPGEGAMSLEIGAPASDAPPEPMSQPMPKPMSQPSTTSTTEPSGSEPAPSAMPATEIKPQPGPPPSGEPVPPGDPQADSNPKPAPAMATDAKLTNDEKEAWQKGMSQAKRLIGDHKFEEAEKLLTELKSAVKTSRQRDQLERLEQVLGLVKDFRQAMVDAIDSLGPAETFKAGTSTIASFVEGDDQRISVRVSGRNITNPLEDLPVGLGLGLVDLALDVEHASTLARKGAYILTHPNAKAAQERGKQMLRAAAEAGAITPELAKFYEDDYSLSDN